MYFFAGVRIHLWILVFVVVGMTLCHAGKSEAKTDDAKDIGDVWSLDFSTISWNPNKWDETLKSRLIKIAVAVAFAATLTTNYFLCGGLAVFLFGAKSLTWPLTGAATGAFYGYVRKQPLWLLGCAALAYALLFGMKLI